MAVSWVALMGACELCGAQGEILGWRDRQDWRFTSDSFTRAAAKRSQDVAILFQCASCGSSCVTTRMTDCGTLSDNDRPAGDLLVSPEL